MTSTLSGLSVVLLVAVLVLSGCEEAPVTPPVGLQTGTIKVSSTPSGARVFFDGSDTGQVTPYILVVSAGSHTIRLTLAGHSDWGPQSVSVIAGDTATVNAALKPTTAPHLSVGSAWSAWDERPAATDGLLYISVTIENAGDARAPATTVRLFQSDQWVSTPEIAAFETELWKAAVPALRAGETWTGDVPDYAVGEEDYWYRPGHNERGQRMWNTAVIAPSSPGTVFYRLCVDLGVCRV